MTPGHVWLESYRPGPERHSYRFSEPREQVEVRRLQDMIAAFELVERAIDAGHHAVCVISYESAPAFDDALRVQTRAEALMPLAWIGVYGLREEIAAGTAGPEGGSFSASAWQPSIDASVHGQAVGEVRNRIGAGDVYQVNYTFPVTAEFSGDPASLYRQMCRGQGSAAFCAYIDLGHTALLSASPELFFALDPDGRIRTRPMKGTRRRGRWSAEDEALRHQLVTSPKDRAENLMIVDLLRNDLGRVAEAGTVQVASLWDVEPYDTVWQMTSTVLARLRRDVRLWDLFAALFPCGSITGAPKVQASTLIHELEGSPRGPYTGSIGYVSPKQGSTDSSRALGGVEAVFNVAIRTVAAERASGRLTAGVGGGLTWDSTAALEFDECMDKIRFLSRRPAVADFDLLESLLFDATTGYYLLERHMQRLEASARYFGFACDTVHIRDVLQAATAAHTDSVRVRLQLSRDGSAVAEIQPLDEFAGIRTAVVVDAVDAGDVYLYHKTTRRDVYARAQAQAHSAGADEAILCNVDGELTECTIGNLVLEVQGRRRTPALHCGLLPGVFREELLATGQLEEGILMVSDLHEAEAVYMINSVRRWVRLDTGPRIGPVKDSRQEGAACTE